MLNMRLCLFIIKKFEFSILKNYMGGKKAKFRYVFHGRIKTRKDWHLPRFGDDFVKTSDTIYEDYFIFANVKPILKFTTGTLKPNNLLR